MIVVFHSSGQESRQSSGGAGIFGVFSHANLASEKNPWHTALILSWDISLLERESSHSTVFLHRLKERVESPAAEIEQFFK